MSDVLMMCISLIFFKWQINHFEEELDCRLKAYQLDRSPDNLWDLELLIRWFRSKLPTSRSFAKNQVFFRKPDEVLMPKNMELACQITGISFDELKAEIESKIRARREENAPLVSRIKEMLESEKPPGDDLDPYGIEGLFLEMQQVLARPTPVVDAFLLSSEADSLAESVCRLMEMSENLTWGGNPEKYPTLKEELISALRQYEREEPDGIQESLDYILGRSPQAKRDLRLN